MQFPTAPLGTSPTKKKSVKIKSPIKAHKTPLMKRGPKPKYPTPDVAKTAGVTAGTARPSFDTDSSSHNDSDNEIPKASSDKESLGSDDEIRSSDLDTDFSADDTLMEDKDGKAKPSSGKTTSKPTLKLKIKLPPNQKEGKTKKRKRRSSTGQSQDRDAKPLSKKMRESLALNQRPASSEEDQFEESNEEVEETTNEHGESNNPESSENVQLYCFCQCPHDDISEMIGCDAPDCKLEWFHFECVGIMVPPAGKWYCPQCTKRYGLE